MDSTKKEKGIIQNHYFIIFVFTYILIIHSCSVILPTAPNAAGSSCASGYTEVLASHNRWQDNGKRIKPYKIAFTKEFKIINCLFKQNCF